MQPQLLHIMCTVRWLSSSVASPLFSFFSSSCSSSSDLETWNLSTLGLHFRSLISPISDSSSVSVKEVQGVLMGPTSGAVNLITLD